MFELVLRAPRGPGRAGVRCADRRTRRAVGLGRGRRRRQRCRAGAVRRARHAGAPGRLAALDAARAVRRRSHGHGRRHAAAGAGLVRRAARAVAAAAARPGLGATDAVAVRAGGRSRRGFWIVPSWHEPPAGAQRDPARPGPGLRHRHAPDHAHVPALDRRPRRCAGRARRARARLRLRLGHPRHRRGAARRAPTSTQWTSTRPRCRPPRPTRRPTACRCAPACPNWPTGRYSWCWPTSWPRR